MAGQKSAKPFLGNDKKAFAILLVLLAVFAAISAAGFSLEYSDQNLYYYMGKMLADGKVPYRDFFFAHPPGEILVNAAIYKAFGFSLLAYKIFTLLPSMAAAFLIFLTGKKAGSNFIGLLSAAIFLFTYETIRISAGNLGIGFTTLFLVLALYYTACRKPVFSGISAGIAAFFALHAIPFAIGIWLAFTLVINKQKLSFRIKDSLYFLGGLLGTFLLSSLILLAMAGSQYIDQAFLFHLQKPSAPIEGYKLSLLKLMFQYNSPVFLAGIFAVVMAIFALKKTSNGQGHAQHDESIHGNSHFFSGLWWVILAYSAYLAFLSRIFPYYFFGLFPVLSLLGAFYLGKAGKGKKSPLLAIGWIALAMLAGNAVYGASQYYFTAQNTFGDGIIEDISNSIEDKPAGEASYIFGDYLFVPIVALEKNLEVPNGFVDTNPLRFEAKTAGDKEIMDAVAGKTSVYLVLRQSNSFMLAYNGTGQYLDNNCKIMLNRQFSMPSYFGRQIVKDKAFVLHCSNSSQQNI